MLVKLLILSSVVATIPLTQDKETQQVPKVLDDIIVEGDRLAPDIEQTGRVVLRPLLTPLNKRNPVSPTQQIDFIFSPVVIDEDGKARLYEGGKRTRFRSTIIVPSAITPLATNFNPKVPARAYRTQTLDVPGGTYALSEIVYHIVTTTTFGDPGGRTIQTFRTQEESKAVRYCLSEGTLLLDVENNVTQYIGALALADLPKNGARHPSHSPLVALSRDLDVFPDLSDSTSDQLIAASLGVTELNTDDNICTADAHRVAAWKPRKKR